MWIVDPNVCDDGTPFEEIIHIDCILCTVHLIGVYSKAFVLQCLTLHDSLDAFDSYYVNKYIDHHVFKVVF
jgi:hypothetical protein